MLSVSRITHSATPSTSAPLEPPNANQRANSSLEQCLQAIQAKDVQAAQGGWSALNQNDQTCLIESLTSAPKNIANLRWLVHTLPVVGYTIITINGEQYTVSEWLESHPEQPAILHGSPLSHEAILATSPIQASSCPSHPQATPKTATGRLSKQPENGSKNSEKRKMREFARIFNDLVAQSEPLSEENIEKGRKVLKTFKDQEDLLKAYYTNTLHREIVDKNSSADAQIKFQLLLKLYPDFVRFELIPDPKNPQKSTALIMQTIGPKKDSQEQKIKNIDLLIKHGADVNFQTPTEKATALMKATYHSNTDIIVHLLHKGANKRLMDKDGKTVIEHIHAENFKKANEIKYNKNLTDQEKQQEIKKEQNQLLAALGEPLLR